ncbi:MAG: extracellular solute-binding protein [Opitutaceae bacterium]|jgi:raffinose/stachyose/melibiose transport system permease protein
MVRKVFCALLLLALGAAGRAGPVLDIPVFAGGYGTAFYQQTARQFEALRPGVKINLYGDPRIADKVRVRVIDGHLPDATLTSELLWPVLIHAGKVLDLTPWLDGPNWEGGARWRDTFFPGALDSWRVGGRIYGLPFTYACWTIFYNRALFREHGWSEPRTWDEFFSLCEKIRAAGLAPLSAPGTRWLYPDAFLRAAYHNLAGDAGWRAVGDLAPGARLDPRYVRSAELLQRVMQRDVLPGWEGETHTGAELAFLEGRVAMTVSGSWLVNEMQGKIPAGFELGTMNFPVFPDGRADPTTLQTGADCFFVFATGDAQRERLTVDFLRFLTSRARAEAFVRLTDSPVAVRGVPDAAYSIRMRDTAALIAHAKASFNMPQTMLQPPAIRQALIDASQLLTTGKITPQQFADRLEAAAARDRARAVDPDRVEMNHPFAGAALLAGLGAVAIWALGGRWRRKKSSSSPEKDAFFGPLRLPVAFGFVGPAFLLYGSLVLLPGAVAFGWAFMRWDGIGPRAWAGLFNFKWLLFESDAFWLALRNNLYLVVVPTLVVVPVSLMLAALIHRGVWGAKAFRVVLLFPNLLGGIAATLLWMSAYEPHGGLVNAGLAGLGRLAGCGWLRSFADYPWLAQEHLYVALIPIYIWLSCGFNLILYLAAMEGIDPQLYEAAELDGASAAWQFFTITVPLIWEMIAISAVFIVIGGLNAFEMVWLLTSQDPAAGVHTLGTLLVATMFKEFAIGRATAIAVVMFALVFAASVAVLRLLRRESIE